MSFLFHLAQAGVIVFNDLCMQLCKCSNLALQLSTGNDPQVFEVLAMPSKKTGPSLEGAALWFVERFDGPMLQDLLPVRSLQYAQSVCEALELCPVIAYNHRHAVHLFELLL
jgi:hypothetical protein